MIEHCPVSNIILDSSTGIRKIKGVETPMGVIKTNCIVNACGAWSRDVARLVNLDIPVAVFKHSYVITENIPNVKNTPNIRDHDRSIYYRVLGESLHLGGYEKNPLLIKEVRGCCLNDSFCLKMSLYRLRQISTLNYTIWIIPFSKLI